jgi:hypothetical protein
LLVLFLLGYWYLMKWVVALEQLDPPWIVTDKWFSVTVTTLAQAQCEVGIAQE